MMRFAKSPPPRIRGVWRRADEPSSPPVRRIQADGNRSTMARTVLTIATIQLASILCVIIVVAASSIDAYLSAHEGSQNGFWLKFAKAGAPEATITKAQAIEAALCHGWIDGQLGKFDEHYFLVRMT